MKRFLRNAFFKTWYWYISFADKKAEVIYMNYGYSKDNFKISLEEQDEKDRYSAQLYHFVASGRNINEKDILEVGCGRGGGLSFINRYFKPKTATGLDLNKTAIEFCKKNYPEKNLNFFSGNAENLPFDNESFDIVLNVESSHRYPSMEIFLSEVYRVLRPGGYFLFTDFREIKDMEKLNKQLDLTMFAQEHYEKITPYVVEALKNATKAREILVKNIIPKAFQNVGKNFAATESSETYKRFANNDWEYF